jgi:hypothetical protein
MGLKLPVRRRLGEGASFPGCEDLKITTRPESEGLHKAQRGQPQPKGTTTDGTDGTDKDFSIHEILKSVAQILSRKQEVDRDWFTPYCVAWVAQATRRPELRMTVCCSAARLLVTPALDLPPGQWPGGTGG